jgi:predicted  nucleic acid-binding Zn-ribbon protein
MADRDVEWDLKATDHSGAASRSAADGLEKVADKADKAKRKLDDLGDETGHLARKMAEARASANALAREFDKTGDTKILKDFEKAGREAAKLGRVMKSLKFDSPDVRKGGLFQKLITEAKKAGLIAGDAVVTGMGDVFKMIPGGGFGALIAGLVGAAVLAAPVIAGVVEGGVVAGIGAGGIGAGLILAARDPAVIRAYGELGVDIMKRLEDSARPFRGELLDTAPKLSAAFDQEEPRIRRIFNTLSTAVGPLVDRTIEAVHALMPAIERASATAVPIIRAIAAQLPALAGDVANLINAFSKGGPGAAAAIGLIIAQLRAMIAVLAFGAQQSAPFLNIFGRLIEMSHLVPKTTGTVGVLSDTLDKSGAGAAMTAQQYETLAQSLGNTANQANALNQAFERLFNEQMSVDQANLAVNVGMSNLRETIKGNKKTLDESTESGQQNTAVILQQIQALEAKRQADIAAGNGTVEATAQANAAYAGNVAALRAVLISLGLAAGEVDRLIGAYAAIPRDITTTITTVYRKVGSASGISDQSTGHSRTGTEDYSALSGWRAAQFAAGQRAAFAETAGGGVHTPPVEVHAEHAFTVLLDGAPFRAVAIKTVAAAEKRQAWRAKVGRR